MPRSLEPYHFANGMKRSKRLQLQHRSKMLIVYKSSSKLFEKNMENYQADQKTLSRRKMIVMN